MKNDRLAHLAHKIFIGTKDGEEFLKLLKEAEESLTVFPVDPAIIARHGSPAGWANFRAGNKCFINNIYDMIHQYENKLQSERVHLT